MDGGLSQKSRFRKTNTCLHLWFSSVCQDEKSGLDDFDVVMCSDRLGRSLTTFFWNLIHFSGFEPLVDPAREDGAQRSGLRGVGIGELPQVAKVA